ncbi:zinc ribbon domain-containing protein [Bacillus sp. FJAT-49732]|uniref:Zinc ribbon domain-containing protein n=1 Tax=Lederbergia citrisecunda TaxID=2833583 RepID=A0A942TLC0_9BACI|nr:zinc ribbon domain-containing protein [Lederbergia citrisecunda]MBS4198112.1 zinc ribbon domain-containing protein [Lederbergia citrisecunda]
MKIYKKCQSCAMPLKNNEDRGIERNLEKSNMYCKHCYQNGEFTQKDISVNEMKQLVKDKCIEMGFPKFLAGIFVKNIHKLERWK